MSTYCTRSDIEAKFGPNNVSEWGDLNNNDDAAEITARITAAIAAASADIDDYLRGCPYRLPLANDAGDTPTTITDLAANVAGLWLYENRGVEDVSMRDGRPYHKLSFVTVRVRRTMKEIKDGTRRLDAVI